MSLKLTIETLVSSAGDTVRLAPAGVTCLVGGNNAGKSQLLRDIEFMVSEPDSEPVTLTAMTGSKPSGSVEEVSEWLEKGAGMPIEQTVGQAQRWVPTNAKISGESATDFQTWFEARGTDLYLGNAAPFFIHRAEAGALKEYASGLAYDGQNFNGGLAKLLVDGDLEEELSEAVESVFGTPVTLDRVNPQAQLRVGKTTVEVPPINRPTKAYSDAVSDLKPLDAQGDGMRAFAGLALLVLTGASNVLLIDEPEAFLHPGQARALGRWLAEQSREKEMQIVIATHDRDVVLGLLDAEGDRSTNIVRIVRTGRRNVLTQLSPSEIEKVWKDPVLRYSNLLQGLFHQRVVICESDADCRFYSAALDDLGATTNRKAEAQDVLFVPSGSKNRIASMVSALTKLGVQAMAIVDFDVLRISADIRLIVESVGAKWDMVLKEKYLEMIRSDDQKALWIQLKKQGLHGLANGPSYSAGRSLLAELTSLGIHVVPVGEMEQFGRDIKGHGGEWVSAALEQRTYSTEGVRAFVEALITRSTERLIV